VKRRRGRPASARVERVSRRRRGSSADAVFACDFYQTKQGARSLAPAEPRPFGSWFEAHVAPMNGFYQSGAGPRGTAGGGLLDARRGNSAAGEYSNGLVFTDARKVQARPRASWEGLLAQLSHNAPEAGHYVEKASTYLFHPSSWCA